jgi:NAD(P)-dependent dehydrogenase (short-subunit alcohol dehydrogenase family)
MAEFANHPDQGTGRLKDRVAIVTGGASGIGAATSRVFAAEGARVAVFDLDGAAAESVARGLPGEAMGLTVDVAHSEQVDRALDAVAARWGDVDIVMHAAGVDDPTVKARMAEQVAAGEPLNITVDMSDELWHRMISINLDGAFYVVRAALRHMLPREAGSIVLVGSTGGIDGVRAYPHYSAAKAGVHALGRAVAAEVAHKGIRVNSIAPGPIDTPMRSRTPTIMGGADATASPLGRPGRAQEIATAALFLASDDASFITGETLVVSGGRLMV